MSNVRYLGFAAVMIPDWIGALKRRLFNRGSVKGDGLKIAS